MNREELISEIAAHAEDARCDTALGRAFLRAIGMIIFEPFIENEIVEVPDKFEGIDELFAQRYGLAY